MAGRVFFDCNQYEVASAEEVKEDVRRRNNVLTDTAAFFLDKAVALFNAIVLVKNINLPDSVATDLEELGAGTASARVTARNRVLKNLWTNFWHIVPGASNEEMDLWVQFTVQVCLQIPRVLTRSSCLAASRVTGFWMTSESKTTRCLSRHRGVSGERTCSQTTATSITAAQNTERSRICGSA